VWETVTSVAHEGGHGRAIALGVGSILVLSGCSSVNGAVSAGQSALDSASQAVEAADPSSTSLGVPRSTLEMACALVTLGG
jgi:uncharacterized protein YceK